MKELGGRKKTNGVKKIKRRKLKRKQGRRGWGRGNKDLFWRKQDTDTKQEYAAMKKEQ